MNKVLEVQLVQASISNFNKGISIAFLFFFFQLDEVSRGCPLESTNIRTTQALTLARFEKGINDIC